MRRFETHTALSGHPPQRRECGQSAMRVPAGWAISGERYRDSRDELQNILPNGRNLKRFHAEIAQTGVLKFLVEVSAFGGMRSSSIAGVELDDDIGTNDSNSAVSGRID